MDWGTLIQLGMQKEGEGKADRLNQREMDLYQQMMDEARSTPLPELEAIQAEQLGPSRMESVETDPELRQAELDALGRLLDISRSGGMTLEDREVLNKMLGKSSRQASAARQGLEEQFASRGQLGSGAQLAMGLQGSSDAAMRAQEAGLTTAAAAEKRALDAMMSAGRLGGDIRAQDFSENSRRADAADYIARQNAQAREKAGYYNAGLSQQQFQNRMARARGQQPAAQGLAGAYASQAGDARARGAGYGRAAAEFFDSNRDNGAGSYYSGTPYSDREDYYRNTPARLGEDDDQ